VVAELKEKIPTVDWNEVEAEYKALNQAWHGAAGKIDGQI
jgi:hypothetical protein